MYLRVGQVATERKVKDDSVVVVGVPGTDRLTATRAGQLYHDNQLQYPGLPIVMMLTNSKTVTKKLGEKMPWLSPKMQKGMEERLHEAEVQMEDIKAQVAPLQTSNVNRAKLFLDYGGKVQGGQELSRKEIDEVVRAVHEALRRERMMTPPTKEQVRNYIREGQADEQTLSRLQMVNPAFGKLIEYAELGREVEQIRGELEQVSNLQRIMATQSGKTHGLNGLEVVVQAVSAIKSGNVPHDGIVIDGPEVKVYRYTRQMLKLLVGAEPGKQFLCRLDAIVGKEEGNGILVPFPFRAANGTNLPEELRQRYLPTEDFAAYAMVLAGALTNILLAYIRAGETVHKGMEGHVGLLIRSLMPANRAIQTLYPEDLVAIPSQPHLAAEIAARAVERFKNGEMAGLAARQLGLTEKELSQEGLERLVSLQNQVMPILPMDVYQLATTNTRKEVTEQKLRTTEGYINKSLNSPFADIREYGKLQELHGTFTRQRDQLIQEGRTVEKTLRDEFGVNTERLADYEARVEDAIKFFGEGIGFIRHVFEAAGEAA
ncbi:hypothetical protein HYV83_03855 [Candidatus Woesearchaeota archaeon]|nr:hypothetical protein [Candidatus Woesearchaeota archaeon]